MHHLTIFPPVVSVISRISQLIEAAADEFLKQDPDPLDDRHPAKTYPSCLLGHMLKVVNRYDEFMNKVIYSFEAIL